MKIGSCFWSHNWGQWKETERGNIETRSGDGEKRITGNYIVQERICQGCGFKQMETQHLKIV